MNEYWTSPQTARFLGLQPQTLRRWRLDGKGPAYTRLGDNKQGRILYKISEVEKWLADRTFRSTSAETAT